jgi:hypothetical protein
VLIVLAALGAKRPGPVATRDIERVLEQGGDAPVYGLASCAPAGAWKPRAGCAPASPNLQLAVELTDAGCVRWPRFSLTNRRVLAEQMSGGPGSALVRMKAVCESDSFGDERPVALDDRWHLAVRGDYVILLDGTTCLQLWNAPGS